MAESASRFLLTVEDVHVVSQEMSARLVFSDVNSKIDEVDMAGASELVAAIHDLGVTVAVRDYKIDKLEQNRGVNSSLESLQQFLLKAERPEFAKVRWINAENFDPLTLLHIVAMQNV